MQAHRGGSERIHGASTLSSWRIWLLGCMLSHLIGLTYSFTSWRLLQRRCPFTTSYGWNQHVLGSEENDTIRLYFSDVNNLSRVPDNMDFSSPRDWLEHWPDGAYTVIRCDLLPDASRNEWKIWGRDFHLQRLITSYTSFMNITRDHPHFDATREGVLTVSQRILQALLRLAAAQAPPIPNQPLSENSQTFMVTLLCHPNAQRSCLVRGHVCSVSLSNSLPAPCRISIAASHNLPNRLDYPKMKLSSWCRARRPIEQRYKTHDIAEVILTRPTTTSSIDNDDILNIDLQLLEGLTSNLFVLCNNRTLQTAGDNVLDGYARLLILEHARRLGLHVVLEAPRLKDCALWQGVFLTSSIRLLVPVKEVVLISEENEQVTETIWSSNEPHPLCLELFSACMGGGDR